jgi:hypothetical protein
MGMNLVQTPTGGLAVVDDASSGKGSIVMSMAAQVARGATNTVALGFLPANAQIVSIHIPVSVVSNAATTSTVSVGLVGGSATAFSAAQDVKTAIGNFSQAATASWAPSTTSRALNVTYTETGAASSAGTFAVCVNYIVI